MAEFRVELRGRNGRADHATVTAGTLPDAQIKAKRLAMRNNATVVSVSKAKRANISLSPSDRFVLMTRLASMMRAKLGMSESLSLIANSFSGQIKKTARALLERVNGDGQDLDEAMKSLGPSVFPKATVAIVSAGYKAGDAARALSDAAEFETLLTRVKQEAGKGLASALIGLLVGVGALVASTFVIGPHLLNNGFMKNYSQYIHVGPVYFFANVITGLTLAGFSVLAVSYLIPMALRPVIPAVVDKFVMRIPVARDIALARINYVAFYSLGRLIKSGVTVEKALGYAASATPKSLVKNDFIEAQKEILRGGKWYQKLSSAHPTDRAALGVAADQQAQAETISTIAEQYRQLYAHRLAITVPILQTLSALLVTAAGAVFFGEVFLPFLQISRGIAGGGM